MNYCRSIWRKMLSRPATNTNVNLVLSECWSWSAFRLLSTLRHHLLLNRESHESYPPMFRSFNRPNLDFHVRLVVDLQNGNVQSPLTKVRPKCQCRFLDDISFRILYRLQPEQFSQFLQR